MCRYDCEAYLFAITKNLYKIKAKSHVSLRLRGLSFRQNKKSLQNKGREPCVVTIARLIFSPKQKIFTK